MLVPREDFLEVLWRLALLREYSKRMKEHNEQVLKIVA